MKTKALIYCTKAKPYLFKRIDKFATINLYNGEWLYNGKIVCECEVDTEEMKEIGSGEPLLFVTKTLDSLEVCKHSCLKTEELSDYLYNEDKDSKGYALHLSNVKERVMELWETRCEAKPTPYDIENLYANNNWIRVDNYNGDRNSIRIFFTKKVKKAPQNMQWCYVLNEETNEYEKRLLISIRPQWACLILNKIKDIEVRRKVLKGMVE